VPSLPDLRIADLMTLLAVQRTHSISSAARELQVTPSQVSKAMARLERHFGMRLLERGAHGVAMTTAGRQILPRIASAMEELRATNGVRKDQAPALELTIAAPSYVLAHALSRIATELPGTRLRGLELAPAYVRAYVAENVFDMAIVPGGIQNRPAAWTNERAAILRIVLLARPEFASKLGPVPLTVDRVRRLPFIGPARTGGDRFVAISDDCPLSADERWIAHEAQSIGVAVEFVCRTDSVVFGPRIAARRLLEAGALVELAVAGWDMRDALYVVCNGDRVLSPVRAAVIRIAQETFDDSSR
jgi:DNA-binding transcriptional LysR family regulator